LPDDSFKEFVLDPSSTLPERRYYIFNAKAQRRQDARKKLKLIWSAAAACQGEAQRRLERSGDTAFSTTDRASKAAWRFASRRSPKRFGCG